MKRGIGFRFAAVLLAVVLLGPATGCGERWLAANLVPFSAGWVLRDLTMPTTIERQCYQNGISVDCAEFPAALGQ